MFYNEICIMTCLCVLEISTSLKSVEFDFGDSTLVAGNVCLSTHKCKACQGVLALFPFHFRSIVHIEGHSSCLCRFLSCAGHAASILFCHGAFPAHFVLLNLDLYFSLFVFTVQLKNLFVGYGLIFIIYNLVLLFYFISSFFCVHFCNFCLCGIIYSFMTFCF